MEWLKELFVEHSALQAVVVVSLISTIGIGLGKIRFFGISLGTAFIFFVGILAGHFGLSLDPAMLTYAESFGLVIFVYALGLQVGPGFFSSMRADGLRLVSPAIAIVLLGTALAMAMSYAFGVSMPDMSGILCGATTNTPALGAAQQTLQQMGIDANGAALSCAVAYPLGVVGVILAVVFLRKLFVRPCDMPGPDAEHRKNVFIASYRLTNPAVFGKSVHEIATQSHHHFVISRLWRDGRVSIPTSDKTLQENDLILVITTPGEADALRLIFGVHTLFVVGFLRQLPTFPVASVTVATEVLLNGKTKEEFENKYTWLSVEWDTVQTDRAFSPTHKKVIYPSPFALREDAEREVSQALAKGLSKVTMPLEVLPDLLLEPAFARAAALAAIAAMRWSSPTSDEHNRLASFALDTGYMP